MLNRAKAKDSLLKNTSVINGTGVRIIKSCSSNTKSSKVKQALSLSGSSFPSDNVIWFI